jgi:uncharacterized protein
MSHPIEFRSAPGSVEVRTEGTDLYAEGYAIVFDRLSQNLGGFVERVDPSAVRKTLQEADVLALVNHDLNQFLGRSSSGTLVLTPDEVGLRYRVLLPNTTPGRDAAEHLRRGDYKGSSFGFRAILDEWGESPEGFPMRTLKEIALRDVGPTPLPAYLDTDAALRSLAEARSVPFEHLKEAAVSLGDLRPVLAPVEPREDEGRATPTPFAFRSRGIR